MNEMIMNEGNSPTRLLSRKEAAEFLGVRQDTLAVWKCNNTYDLPVVKVGRLARYRYSDLLDFIERRTVNRPLTPVGKKTR
jgi:predicted DNA-binding transcriptional regulator AlpA